MLHLEIPVWDVAKEDNLQAVTFDIQLASGTSLQISQDFSKNSTLCFLRLEIQKVRKSFKDCVKSS